MTEKNQNTLNFVKDNWWKVLILGLVLVIFFIRDPLGCKGPLKATRDTVITRDTQYILQPPVYIPQYTPAQTGTNTPIIIPAQYQPQPNNSNCLLYTSDAADE